MIQKDMLVSETTLRRRMARNMLKHTTIGVWIWNEMNCEERKGRILDAKYYVTYFCHDLGHLHGMYDSTAIGKTEPDAP